MADWDDVRRIAAQLPETGEAESRGNVQWKVKDKLFAWERPLRRSDLETLGDDAPEGPILGVRVPDLGAKEAVIASNSSACFTIPHFDGYAAVLVLLDLVAVPELEELMAEAWLCRAPKKLASEYLRTR
jgi:hypothetical protein